jgi:hypothetical protein
MFAKKNDKDLSTESNGRVLGQLLSREEAQLVGGGAGATDAWADQNKCTPIKDGIGSTPSLPQG